MRVDVVLKTYTGQEWLPEAIDSVLSQTYADWHLIVVDDASPNDTASFVRERYAHESERITVVRLDRNVGPVPAMVEGIRRSTADAVAFIDYDDRWARDKLARQVACLQRATDIHSVHTDVRHIDPSGTVISASADRENALRAAISYEDLSSEELARLLFAENSIRIVSTLTRRTALIEAGRLDVAAEVHDWEFWVRFASTGHRVAHLALPLIDRRIHSNQASERGRLDFIEAGLAATDSLPSEFPFLADLAESRRGRLLRAKLAVGLRQGDTRRAREAIRELRQIEGASLKSAAASVLIFLGPLMRPVYLALESVRRRRTS